MRSYNATATTKAAPKGGETRIKEWVKHLPVFLLLLISFFTVKQ